MTVVDGLRWVSAVALAGVVASTLALGCADESLDADGVQPDELASSEGQPPASLAASAALRERPWEVVSKKGETYLASVFYADAVENEQIMPWSIDGHTMIDRLVYPTLGNPNLYVKSDGEDELVTVLRLEPDAYAHLAPSFAPEGGDSPLSAVTLSEDATKGISFFLVARSERAAAESTLAQVARPGVFAIKPTRVLQNPEPADMPAVLKQRNTLRFVFDRAAMAGVPAGLYDTRFEVRKNGELFANVYEYQYNSVRVFDTASEEYTALNVTDTQVSTGVEYTSLTADKLDDFVDGLNVSSDPVAKNAAFITFNGDLHNGGSPGSLRQGVVAKTYAAEAKQIVGALKRLNLPIFLTAGNHDGYAAIGHAPGPVKALDATFGVTLQSVIDEQNDKAWPDYSWAAYSAFLTNTAASPGGLHRDLFSGAFKRSLGETYAAAFAEVPRSDRNMILYDGLYQWQKTYGPLYTSWTFGKNRWVSMNSFEVRQHRRTGWGMYAVNYGGGMSKPQLEWLDRELARAEGASEDVVVLMHHDPRGGHKGKDLGYYPSALEYRGVAQSTVNFLLDHVLTPLVCKQPDWSLSVDQRESCLHDGLQEWLAPDEEFDKEGATFFLSGVDLLKRFVKSPHARTLVLGHVHYNSLEMLQSGDVLVPNRLSLDRAVQMETASTEAANPVRRMAWEDVLAPTQPNPWRELGVRAGNIDVVSSLTEHSFAAWRDRLDRMLVEATPKAMTTLSSPQGEPRELAILHFTSGADLTEQTYDGKAMYGWSVMHVTKQTGVPRVNRLTYFIHTGVDAFEKIQTIDVDRTRSVSARDRANPVEKLFDR